MFVEQKLRAKDVQSLPKRGPYDENYFVLIISLAYTHEPVNFGKILQPRNSRSNLEDMEMRVRTRGFRRAPNGAAIRLARVESRAPSGGAVIERFYYLFHAANKKS